jgi:hypothetical protein
VETRPGFQSVHKCEPARAERPGQHGAEPAELVAKKVLHQRAGFAHAEGTISQMSIVWLRRMLPTIVHGYFFRQPSSK